MEQKTYIFTDNVNNSSLITRIILLIKSEMMKFLRNLRQICILMEIFFNCTKKKTKKIPT